MKLREKYNWKKVTQDLAYQKGHAIILIGFLQLFCSALKKEIEIVLQFYISLFKNYKHLLI